MLNSIKIFLLAILIVSCEQEPFETEVQNNNDVVIVAHRHYIDYSIIYYGYKLIDENNLSEMIWSCIHEGGHALYEQGILSENYGTPLGNSVSLGIHESQSRLWENHVGRSLEYWKNNYPTLQSLFPEKLKDIDYNKFYNNPDN
mgnify:CR=1 FL=1